MSKAPGVEAAIALLGGPASDPVVDFLVDPGAACRALDAVAEDGGIVVRAAPASPPAAAGYGPAPVAPVWMRWMRGAREVGLSRIQTRAGTPAEVTGTVRRAAHVELDEGEEPCCGAPGCDRKRTRAAVWLVLDPFTEPGAPDRLLVTEQRTLLAESRTARSVASRIATALGVSLRRDGGDPQTPAPAVDAGEPPAPLGEALGAVELARFALRSEGERVVLRDWESAGPRASAARNAWIGATLAVAAAGAWFQLQRSVAAGGAMGMTIATGIAAALLTLASVAFLGVARFSARYHASSAPLWAVGRGRIILLPWVNRDGAVDERPEGRLGAAIPLGEVRSASPKPRGPGVAVELDTDHGPIDVMLCPTPAAAALWCAVIDRAVDEARHPQKGATARQRAKQRAATTV